MQFKSTPFWCFALFALFCLPGEVWSQMQNSQVVLKGRVLDTEGKPVAYASVSLKGSNRATTANPEGQFRLTAESSFLLDSTRQLLVKSVGFRQKILTLHPAFPERWSNLNVIMETEVLVMEEIVIGPREDPANAMIRLAIQNRRRHLEENPPYQAKAYIKGIQRLAEMPHKLLGISMDKLAHQLALDSNRTGIVYLSESESKITADPPDAFREEMISSRISGNNRSFSFNRASDLQMNFYENTQPIVEGLSARPFISPIADQGFQYYQYRFMGYTEDNGIRIQKIRVAPKRKGEPVYDGDIYLIEGQGRIYDVNLTLDRSSSLKLIDSLHIKQQFLENPEGFWFPSGAELNFGLSFLGVRIAGSFVASFSDYETVALSQIRSTDFREKLRVEASALKVDSNYWHRVRPVPLTPEEAGDYVRKDSIRAYRQTPEYLDSVDRAANRFQLTGFILGGYRYTKRSAGITVDVDPFLTRFNYNLVEGFNINYGTRYRKLVDKRLNRSMTVEARVRYGFSNRRFHPSLQFTYPTALRGDLTVEIGSEVRDLQSRHDQPEWLESYYILFQGQNPFKIYEQRFARADWSGAVPGNVHLKGGIWFADRIWADNNSHYSFLPARHRGFTSNNPFHTGDAFGVSERLFPNHRSFGFKIEASYDFGQNYETFPTGRRYLPSRFPTVSLGYETAFSGINGSSNDSGFELVRIGIRQSNVSLQRFGKLSYAVRAGKFLKSPQFYPDFAHFQGTSFLIGRIGIESFLLLDRYLYSAQEHFAEAHLEYRLGGILLSKLPFIRRLKLEETLGLHYLKTEKLDQYAEWQAGISWMGFQLKYARLITAAQNQSLGDDLSWRRGISKHRIRIGIRF